MARSLAEKHQELETLLEATGESLEVGYGRAMRNAIAENDTCMEVETLKCLGDLHLEKGQLVKDLKEFKTASTFYSAALLRCKDPDLEQAIQDRTAFMGKLAEILQHKDSRSHNVNKERQDTLRTSANDVLRVAEVCHQLSMARFEGLSGMYVLEEGYTKALIRAIATGDGLLEIELVKSLGDLYLETGKACADESLLSKAIAMYNNARARCGDTDGKEALTHRVKYTERVKSTAIRMRRGSNVYDHGAVDAEENPDGTAIMRTYREHHRLGDRALRKGAVDLAERRFASALKLVHGTGSAHLNKEAETLQKLGDVYLERGKVTKDGEDFTKSAALYNASMARTENRQSTKDLIFAIKRTEESFLQHVIGVSCVASPYELDLRHKSDLKEMRDKVKQQLGFIDEQHDPFKYEEDDPEVRKAESARAAAVRALFQKTAKDRSTFLDNLVSECITVMGPPPCRYAIIGLGSQATELVTLYSDLEFAILLEDGRDSEENKMYFRILTHFLHLKIINLGETILPAMAIKSLNDFYSKDPEDSWFYDSITTRGLAFDGAMPWASHTPLGRKQTENKPALELIQTPSQLAKFQESDAAMSEEDHLSDVLRSVCHITGDKTLVEQYRVEVMATLKSNALHANMELANREEFRNPELVSTLLNVKKEIYRFSTIAVQNIALRCGVGTSSVWATIEELEAGGYISNQNAHHIAVLVAISAELRLRTYMANGGQKENMSALLRLSSKKGHSKKTVPDLEKVFYLPNQKMLYRYYYSALPLRRALSELQKENASFSLAFSLFETSEGTKGEMKMKLCDFISAKALFERALERNQAIHGNGKGHPDIAACFRNLGWVCYSMGEYGDARAFLQQALDMYHRIHGSTHPAIAASLRSLGAVASCMGDYKQAETLFEQALETLKLLHGDSADQEDISSVLHNLGSTWADMGNNRKAVSFYEKCLEIRKSLHDSKTAHPDVASVLNSLGAAWNNLGDYKKAIDFYRQALILRTLTYGGETVHPDIVSSLGNLGTAYLNLKDHSKAIDLFEQAVQMNNLLYGQDHAHPETASLIDNLGSAWNSIGAHRKALNIFERALHMKRRVYGDFAVHPEIATSLANLGEVWSDLEDHRKALKMYSQALDMYKAVYGQDTAHPGIAITLNHFGAAWRCLGFPRKAIHFYEQALHMRERVYGQNAAHPDIATSLNNLGEAWSQLGDRRKALAYIEQALDTRKRVYGYDVDHPDIAATFNDLGVAWSIFGDPMKVIVFYAQALNMRKRLYGHDRDHPDIAMSLSNLGTAWSILGQVRKALLFYKDALDMRIRIYGDTAHSDIAGSLNNIGIAWVNLGQYRKAIKFFERAIAMKKRLYKNRNAYPKIAVSLNNLGEAWSALGHHGRSLLIHENALHMRRCTYGRDTPHPHTATSLYNLGKSWSNLGDHRKAMMFHEQALNMRIRITGNNESTSDPDIASSLASMGVVLSDIGDYRKAISFYERALKMRNNVYGHDAIHPGFASLYNNLGTAWSQLGHQRKAVDFHELALDIRRQTYGQEGAHPDIASSLNNLGAAWCNLGDYRKALKLYEEALDIRRRAYGTKTAHQDVIRSLANLGATWNYLGRPNKAILCYEEALDMSRAIFNGGLAHHQTASLLQKLGTSWGLIGDHSKAINFFEESLQMQKRLRGNHADHPDVCLLLSNLGASLAAMGDYRKATGVLQEALAMMNKVYGHNAAHPDILRTLKNLSIAWRDMGDHDKAAAISLQAEEMQTRLK
uniref:Protein-PII uridylyltransferase N-terminal domain-containing protein n=1 Tax=Branchiostoma floridae TaxID=7739 RepID=C3XPN7_BRAFL|eukprot:XP_002613899.1 hypothetical protein BRAFLDRAFT_71975 [Branchiostoma floridae]